MATWSVQARKSFGFQLKFPRELVPPPNPSVPLSSFQRQPSLSRSNFSQRKRYDLAGRNVITGPEISKNRRRRRFFAISRFRATGSIPRFHLDPLFDRACNRRGNNQRRKTDLLSRIRAPIAISYPSLARSPWIHHSNGRRTREMGEVCQRFAARILHANLPDACFPNSSRSDLSIYPARLNLGEFKLFHASRDLASFIVPRSNRN